MVVWIIIGNHHSGSNDQRRPKKKQQAQSLKEGEETEIPSIPDAASETMMVIGKEGENAEAAAGKETGCAIAAATATGGSKIKPTKIAVGIPVVSGPYAAESESSHHVLGVEPMPIPTPTPTDVLPGAYAEEGMGRGDVEEGGGVGPPPEVHPDRDDGISVESTQDNNNNNSHLVVATEVVHDIVLPRAQPQQSVDVGALRQQEENNEDSSQKKILLFAFAAAGVIMWALIILPLLLALAKTTDESSKEELSSSAPANPAARPLLPPMKNLELLYDALPQKTKERLLYNNGDESSSPQRQAWTWLLNHPMITTYPEWRKKQVFAMVTFFFAMEGPNWPEATPGHNRWLDTNNSECSWVLNDKEVAYFAQESAKFLGPGAYSYQDTQPCNKVGELRTLVVFQLYLPTSKLDKRPSIPPEIGLLTSLMGLSVVFSQITAKFSDLLVPELVQLSSLRILSLQGSGVGTIPKELGLMTGLRHLPIGANDFTGTIPSELGMMTSLEFISLDGMDSLHGKLPSELLGLTRLTSLDLGRDSLTGSIPTELGLLTSIKRLSFDGNKFTGSLPKELWELSHIDRLLLSNQPNISGSIPRAMFMPDLAMFSLSGSPHLSGTIPDHICFSQELDFDCSDILCG